MFDNFLNLLIEIIIIAPTILIALSFHEFAHGYLAYKLGDPTAKYMGRLTLNPIKHIDPIGALCMLLAHFGWAKPVPIDIVHFKHPKRDLAITALAGPFINFILGIIGCFLSSIVIVFLPSWKFIDSSLAYNSIIILHQFIYYFGLLNISLAFFNLLPIPPLDGSKILYAFLPPRANNWCKTHEREIAFGFFVILFVDYRFLNGLFTGFLHTGVTYVFNSFTNLFIKLFV